MRPFFFRVLCLLVLNLMLCTVVQATHYQGGEISYTYMGGTSYRISVRIYHDCRHGDDQAAKQDLPIFYAVFNANGTPFHSDSMNGTFLQLPQPTAPACHHDTNRYCGEYATLEKTISLPPTTDGYVIVNQRCCLGHHVVNITDAQNEGLTISCSLPGTASGVALNNSSPAFKSLPPLRVCRDEPFSMDFGAIDREGDSVVYRLATANKGGSSNNAKPRPSSIAFLPLPYAPAYAPQTPFGPDGTLSLDPATGILSGVCNTEGDYVISVACDEYRNGLLASTITRSYVLPVADCGSSVVADIAVDSAVITAGLQGVSITRCEGLRTVTFSNQSKGAQRFHWDFGVPGRSDDTSVATDPVFTYPAAGRYQITLIAFGDAGCSDTLHTEVWLSDDVVNPDFLISGGPCVLDTLLLTDNSTSSGSSIVQNIWRVDNVQYNGNPLSLPLTHGGQLGITHSIMTAEGCVGTTSGSYDVGSGDIRGGNDTTVVVGDLLILQASGGSSYNWTYNPPAYAQNYIPGTGNLEVFTANPGSNFLFILTGQDAQGCGGIDTVRVNVAARSYAFVPSAFSPNGDGRNDVLTSRLAGNNFLSFSIFDRRGKRVFYSENIHEGWNGSYKNEAAPAATYFWLLSAKDGTGKGQTFKGDVMLLR